MRKVAVIAGGLIVVATLVFLMKSDPTPKSSYTETATTTNAIPEVPVEEKHAPLTPLYSVIKVIDGDTLAIDMNEKNTTLRLIGLDTPETLDPRKLVQCFGTEASNKAKELLSGKKIALETDATQGELDKYGRMLAYVYLPDGTLFNQYMIAEGYGHEYMYNLPYKYQVEFKVAEKSAREMKKGLWADTACASESWRPPPSTNTAPPIIPVSGAYDCSGNMYNCTSFKTSAEATAAFEICGGSANDVHKLDSDKDGKVCESLP